MKIICISGKAQAGKDFAAEQLKSQLSLDKSRVLITHFADLLKYICKKYFCWDGKKDVEGRHLLQHIGTDVFREHRPDYWVDFVIDILKFFPNEWDYVIIPDCRFQNEIERLKESDFCVITIRVERPNLKNNDMDEQSRKHSSETALDEYSFDECFLNYGDIRLVKDLEKFVENIKKEVV